MNTSPTVPLFTPNEIDVGVIPCSSLSTFVNTKSIKYTRCLKLKDCESAVTANVDVPLSIRLAPSRYIASTVFVPFVTQDMVRAPALSNVLKFFAVPLAKLMLTKKDYCSSYQTDGWKETQKILENLID